MHREAVSKLIAIGYLSAIMNFIIHTHINIFFFQKLHDSKQFISYLTKQAKTLYGKNIP